MPLDLLRRAAADATKRLFLILAAAIVLGGVVILACCALVVALDIYLPLWAAFAITAGILLIVTFVFVALAVGSGPSEPAKPSPEKTPQSGAFDLGEAIGAAARQRPKTTLGAALAAGAILGANPGLRRDIVEILKTRTGNASGHGHPPRG